MSGFGFPRPIAAPAPYTLFGARALHSVAGAPRGRALIVPAVPARSPPSTNARSTSSHRIIVSGSTSPHTDGSVHHRPCSQAAYAPGGSAVDGCVVHELLHPRSTRCSPRAAAWRADGARRPRGARHARPQKPGRACAAGRPRSAGPRQSSCCPCSSARWPARPPRRRGARGTPSGAAKLGLAAHEKRAYGAPTGPVSRGFVNDDDQLEHKF